MELYLVLKTDCSLKEVSVMWGILLFLVNSVLTSKVRFELDLFYLGHGSSQSTVLESILKSLSNVSIPSHCAAHCVKNQNCSAFGFNVKSNVCQLLGDMMFDTPSPFEPRLEDQRYYIIRKEWCSLKERYFVYRDTGLCLRWSNVKRSANRAKRSCMRFGGQLAVLNSEKKRNAVFSALQRLGFEDKLFHLGASDETEEGQWVWNDDSPVSMDWFDAAEPNGNTTENCLLARNGSVYDGNCENVLTYFLCEMTRY